MSSRGTVRPYQASDREALYSICLLTGDSGQDATGLYQYPRLLGDVFVGPYLALETQFAFVVAPHRDDAVASPGGYILGALDSHRFQQRAAEQYWPAKRDYYVDCDAPAGTRDRWLLDWIARPPAVPEFAADYPSHVHIDLAPAWQSGGWGRQLMDTLLASLADAGSDGVHLGVGTTNERAIGFYHYLGFTDIVSDTDTVWMGKRFT